MVATTYSTVNTWGNLATYIMKRGGLKILLIVFLVEQLAAQSCNREFSNSIL